MSENRLGNFVGCIGLFGEPVTQARTETVRSRLKPAALHEPGHGGVRYHALPDAREEMPLSSVSPGCIDDAQRFGDERNAEIDGSVATSFHTFGRYDPDVSVDLIFRQEF